MANPDERDEASKEDKSKASAGGSNSAPAEEISKPEAAPVVQSAVDVEGDDKVEVGSPAKIPALEKEAATGPEADMASAIAAAASRETAADPMAKKSDGVEFKVVFNKKKHNVSLPLETSVRSLKDHLQPIIEIPPHMMKVMIKGLAKDQDTLAQLGVTKGSKIMVVGSSLNDVLQVSTAPKKKVTEEEDDEAAATGSEAQKTKLHKKVLDKGKPEDAMPGIKGGGNHPLPPSGILSGMLNKQGSKVRLTFKLDSDQVWIGTKDRTQKLPMNSIKNVLSEPIEGHEDYHIVALQLGATEASRYWIYWVPAQYVESVKDAILGKWAFH